MVVFGMSLSQDQLLQDIEHLSRTIRALDAENADLKAEIDYLKRLIHGARSEKLATIDPTQTSLDLGDLTPSGSVDLEGSIARELAEETGLRIEDAEIGALFAVRDGPRLSVARELRFDEEAPSLRARMLAHSRATDEEELSDILILRRTRDLPAVKVPAFSRLIASHLLG